MGSGYSPEGCCIGLYRRGLWLSESTHHVGIKKPPWRGDVRPVVVSAIKCTSLSPVKKNCVFFSARYFPSKGTRATVLDRINRTDHAITKQNEHSKILPFGPAGWGIGRNPCRARKVSRNAEEIFRNLYSRLPEEIDYSRFAGAEIGAVAGGFKPLRHEQIELHRCSRRR